MQIRVRINGDFWKFKIVTAKFMAKQKESADAFAALCVPSERTIYVDEDCIEYDTILHELFHAYFSYLYLDDTTTLTLTDMEEILAVFFCSKAPEIIKKAKTVIKKLTELQEDN